MGLTNFPNGVSSFGVPVLGSSDYVTTGDYYFVDSGATNSSDGNLGTDPGAPLATLNGAMDKVTASNGDIVFLMPGHAENVSTATSQVCDVAGVRFVGLGEGSLRPTFTWTATAGIIDIGAANVSFENVKFLSSISAVVIGIDVDANYFELHNCEFNFDATGDDFLNYVDLQDTTGCKIINCDFIAEEATAGANSGITLDNADETLIEGCYFHGDFALAPIYGDTTDDTGSGSTISNNLRIVNCKFYIDDTVNSLGIDLNQACTGVIAYNLIGGPHGSGAQASSLDPGSCMCFENYAVDAIDQNAVQVPVTDAT